MIVVLKLLATTVYDSNHVVIKACSYYSSLHGLFVISSHSLVPLHQKSYRIFPSESFDFSAVESVPRMYVPLYKAYLIIFIISKEDDSCETVARCHFSYQQNSF